MLQQSISILRHRQVLMVLILAMNSRVRRVTEGNAAQRDPKFHVLRASGTRLLPFTQEDVEADWQAVGRRRAFSAPPALGTFLTLLIGSVVNALF
jgi:hypothetical protein